MDSKFSIEYNIIKGVIKPVHDIPNKHDLGSIFLNSFISNQQNIAQINVETGEKRTFDEIKNRSIRCALWLQKEKIHTGDVVSICTYNQLDACIPILATFYNGAIYNPWYHDVTLDSARHFMRLVEPKIIFSCKSSVAVLLEAAKLEKQPVKIIVFGVHPAVESLRDTMNCHSEEEIQNYKPKVVENPLDIAIILFSSGTTGLPKAVTHCYNNVIDNLFTTTRQVFKISLWYSGLCWISGTYHTLKTLLTGSTAIIHSSFDVDETLKVLNDFKVQGLFLSSQMLAQIAKHNALEKYEIRYLKGITTGGAKVNPQDLVYIKKYLPHVNWLRVYGITEAGSAPTCATEKNSINSVGHVLPNQQLKFIDTVTGEALGPNQQGEILVKPSGLMMGYYKNSIATKETIDEEGWLHAGDLGYYNESGEIFLTDRLKEVMKYCGHHVAPSEIESLLLTHPEVLEVAVVPVPHDIDLERPMAFVKKVPGATVTEEELIKMSSKLGEHKKLRGGVKFLDSFPRTSSGKVNKKELKNIAKSYKK